MYPIMNHKDLRAGVIADLHNRGISISDLVLIFKCERKQVYNIISNRQRKIRKYTKDVEDMKINDPESYKWVKEANTLGDPVKIFAVQDLWIDVRLFIMNILVGYKHAGVDVGELIDTLQILFEGFYEAFLEEKDKL